VIGDAPLHQRREGDFIKKITVAGKKGYALHTMSPNQGSRGNPKRVRRFDDYAKAGGGASVILSNDQSVLLQKILTLIFGKEYMEFTTEFCGGLIQLESKITPLKKKKG